MTPSDVYPTPFVHIKLSCYFCDNEPFGQNTLVNIFSITTRLSALEGQNMFGPQTHPSTLNQMHVAV